MDVSNLTYPEGYSEPTEPKVSDFEDLIWHNAEVCNNCFQQVRSIGEILEKRTDLFVHRQNSTYGRTEHGSQEHDPFDVPADRYGRCYCLDCGADTRAATDDLSLSEMKERALNIGHYVVLETDRQIDGRVMARSIKDLKGVHDNGGFDTEIFCVATIEGVEAAETNHEPKKAKV